MARRDEQRPEPAPADPHADRCAAQLGRRPSELDSARRRTWLIGLCVIFLLAWGLRVASLRAYEAQHPLAMVPLIDEESYDLWAQSIAEGDWLGERVFFQEPLYAYALGVLYMFAEEGPARLTTARHVQALLGACSALLVAYLALRLFGLWPGLVAGLAFALHKPAVFISLLLLKPNLVVPLMAILALLLVSTRERGLRAPTALGLGFLVGLGALLRGNLLLMIPLFALLPLARTCAPLSWGLGSWGPGSRGPDGRVGSPGPDRKRALLSCALIGLGALAALLPVATRNWVVGRQFALTTSGAGTNFFGGNNSSNPYGVATEFDWVRGIPEHEAGDWRREAEARTGRRLSETEVSSFWLEESLSSMRRDPLLHARIFLRKFLLSLSSYEVPDNHHLEWDARWIGPLRWPLGGFGVWGWAGLAGLLWFFARAVRGRDPRAVPALEVALFLAAYIATLVLTVMSMRARLAIVPLLLPFAGWFLVRLARCSYARDWRAVGVASACLALTAFVHWPVLDAEERAAKLDTRDHNRARELVLAGDLDAAEQVVARLIERNPTSVRMLVLQHEISYLRGRERIEAPGASYEERSVGLDQVLETLVLLETLNRAYALPTNAFRLDYLSGIVRQYLGSLRDTSEDWLRAVEHFENARAFDSDEPDLRRRHAVSLANASRHMPAAQALQALTTAGEMLRVLIAEGHGDQGLEGLVEQIDQALGRY